MSKYIQVPPEPPVDPAKPENLCTELDKILVDIGVAESRQRITILEKFRYARVNYSLLMGLTAIECNRDGDEFDAPTTPIVLYKVLSSVLDGGVYVSEGIKLAIIVRMFDICAD